MDAQSECAHSFKVFCVKPIRMIIWDISYHGYHELRPRIRLAHCPLATVTLSDGRHGENVRVCHIRCSRRLLRSIRALEHRLVMLRHVMLTPNGIRVLCQITLGQSQDFPDRM